MTRNEKSRPAGYGWAEYGERLRAFTAYYACRP